MRSDDFSVNLRFALWKGGVARESWVSHIAERIGCDAARSEELLRGESASRGEQQRISSAFGIKMGNLGAGSLLRDNGTDILGENLRFIINGLEHGKKQDLAEALGVSPLTVSRWTGGLNHPPAGKIPAIMRFFKIQADTDLTSDPIFLSMPPFTERERKEWAIVRIRHLDLDSLNLLFPALEKLLAK